MVTNLLKCSDIKNYVEYDYCDVYTGDKYVGAGCICDIFTNPDEMDMTIYELFRIYGRDCTAYSYDEIREGLFNILKFDLKPYLDNCLALDSITKNEDRHFNNLSVIKTKREYKFAPIYDNGLACLSDLVMCPIDETITSLVAKVKALPFSTNFRRQLYNITPIGINYTEFLKCANNLTNDYEKRAFEVILYGLDDMRGVSWRNI